jgi:hypothetical protein
VNLKTVYLTNKVNILRDACKQESMTAMRICKKSNEKYDLA